MTQAQARQQLAALIRHSRLSVAGFARLVMSRNPRTVERWLAGDSPVSPVVRDWLERAHVRRTRHQVCVLIRLPGPRV